MRSLVLISASLLILGFSGKAAFAQEKAKADKASGGRRVTVFIDNDRVKVYEGRFSPGEKSPQMSKRPDRVEFALTDGQVRHYYSDGKVEDVTWRAGEVKMVRESDLPAGEYRSHRIRIRVIQLK